MAHNIDAEQELYNILQQEIAKELLLEEDPNITDEDIENIWKKCEGNPANAPILHALFKLTKAE
jgi:hypothetical protein